MAKRIYSHFENDRVVAIIVNMSNEHLDVYAKKFDVDLSILIEMRDIDKAKVVYINLDSDYLIGYKDKDGDFLPFPSYAQFIEQNHKRTFLYCLKPLGTPKLPKSKPPKIVTDNIQTNDFDSIIKEKELLDYRISKMLVDLESELAFCIESEDFEKAAILRDKISKLK
jgi:hypothetical protein